MSAEAYGGPERRQTTPEYRAEVARVANEVTHWEDGDVYAALSWAEDRRVHYIGTLYVRFWTDVRNLLQRRHDTIIGA